LTSVGNKIEPNPIEQLQLKKYKETGDQSILLSLYEPYMELVFGVCLKYLNNRDDAHDAVINIYEELIEKVKKYEIDYFRAWLYQLSKNHCLMILRRKKVYLQEFKDGFMDLSDDAHPGAALLKETQLQLMEHCIEQLNTQQKLSIQLFYLQDKCYLEIASMTEQEVGKVKSHIQNGRRNLKICMEKQATA
jgi:RNA polymerase sigma-70 factor (ECF subfamily)